MGETIGTSLAQGFGQAIFQADSLTSSLKRLAQQILAMAAQQAIVNPASRALSTLFGLGLSAIGGAFTSPAGPPPGLSGPEFSSSFDLFYKGAKGLSGTVGGTGGTDSQFVPLALTPGELVTVETPSQVANRSGSGNGVNVQIFNLPGQDAEVETGQSPNGDIFVRALIRKEIIDDARRDGPMARSLSQVTGSRRQGETR